MQQHLEAQSRCMNGASRSCVRRALAIAAFGVVLSFVAGLPHPAHARVFVSFGFPVFVAPPAFYPPPVYYQPPSYYPYYAPPGYYPAPGYYPRAPSDV